jgi:N-acetylmuramoyl-L-alanine amidase
VKYYLYKILFIIFLLSSNIYASSISDKYFYAKKNYTTSVIIGNKDKQKKYLKQLISFGTKLKKDVSDFKNELRMISSKKVYIQNKKTNKHKKKTKKSINKYYSIKNIRTYKNQIIIDFNHNVSKSYIKFTEKKVGKIYYDVFDIKGNYKDASPLKLKIKNIKKIWVSQYRYKTLRISVNNTYNTRTIYKIEKKRIIIKVYPKTKFKNNNKIKIITPQKRIIRNKIIVIDPGHGGKDSGARGARNVFEKHVVLKISKYLNDELKKNGFKVYMTRTRDKFIELKRRTKFANKKNANIFISIHANSVAKRKAHKIVGIETFFLSPARSERAKRVAALENKSDMNKISGYNSKNTVLSLLNRGKITASQKMAIDIQGNMLYNLKKYYGKKIVDKGVREGPFWVLVGAQMPAILIEVGYISNYNESKRINSKAYQKRIAHGIYLGIVSYFSKN